MTDWKEDAHIISRLKCNACGWRGNQEGWFGLLASGDDLIYSGWVERTALPPWKPLSVQRMEKILPVPHLALGFNAACWSLQVEMYKPTSQAPGPGQMWGRVWAVLETGGQFLPFRIHLQGLFFCLMQWHSHPPWGFNSFISDSCFGQWAFFLISTLLCEGRAVLGIFHKAVLLA